MELSDTFVSSSCVVAGRGTSIECRKGRKKTHTQKNHEKKLHKFAEKLINSPLALHHPPRDVRLWTRNRLLLCTAPYPEDQFRNTMWTLWWQMWQGGAALGKQPTMPTHHATRFDAQRRHLTASTRSVHFVSLMSVAAPSLRLNS